MKTRLLGMKVRLFLSHFIICLLSVSFLAGVEASQNFSDVTTDLGIVPVLPGTVDSGSARYSGGVAWLDFDNDGWLDIFVPNATQAPSPSRLYRNLGTKSYPAYSFEEVGAQANVQMPNDSSAGVAVGDFDGDGLDDLFVANVGSPNRLFHNLGNGQFKDVTPTAWLQEGKLSYVAAFGDVDQDGDLDLYVGHWKITAGSCEANDLYLNTGDWMFDINGNVTGGNFNSVAADLGVDNLGCTFGTSFTDIDNDGDLDIFVVNDNVITGDQFNWNKNVIYKNLLVENNGVLAFQELIIGDRNTEDPTQPDEQFFQGMGIAIGDYDNDGDLDYYRTNIAAGFLATNTPAGLDVRVFAPNLPTDPVSPGDGQPSISNGSGTVGWGASFFDADNDGDLDLLRTNAEFGMPSLGTSFFENNQGLLSEVRQIIGPDSLSANGLATADFDLDGDVDYVLHDGRTDTVALYQNNTSVGQWVNIELHGDSSNTAGVGAKLRLTMSGGTNVSVTQMREVHAGGSHGSTESTVQHFGIPVGYQIDLVTVEWPGATVAEDVTSSVLINDYSLLCQSSCVMGRIKDDFTDDPVQGVEIKVYDSSAILIGAVYTNALGYYVYPTTEPWVFIRIAKEGYTLSRAWQGVFMSSGNNRFDFDAHAIYTLTGNVVNSAGAGVAGLQIDFLDTSADLVETLFTDTLGNYRFVSSVDPSPVFDFIWYFVLPNSSEYSTVPAFQGILIDDNHPIKDFEATIK